MTVAVVLDAAAFDHLDAPTGAGLRALLRRTADRGGEVSCAAVTLAEVCRGVARTRRVEAALARDRGGQRILVVPTDVKLAKLVGMILHATGSASDRLADAHVVAVCAAHDGAVVMTADPDDIAALCRPRCRGPASWPARQCHSGGDGRSRSSRPSSPCQTRRALER